MQKQFMGKEIHILLVDDDPEVLRIFGGKLQNEGFEILYAHDGNEGREIARRMDVDLILLDMKMPVMDGYKTLEELKGEQITKDIPVIIFTNDDLSHDAEESINELGADGYIHKSAPIDEIVKRINKELQHKNIYR